MTQERDALCEQLEQMMLQRDEAVQLAEARLQGWIQDHIHALEMQNHLNDRIEEGLVEIHCLNNLLNPILRPVPVYPDASPQVIVAEDDGMVVDGPIAAAPAEGGEDEEVEPFNDEDGEAIYDAVR